MTALLERPSLQDARSRSRRIDHASRLLARKRLIWAPV